MMQQATAKWHQYPLPQGLLAGKGTADAGRIVLKHGSSKQQATFVLVASNSIEHHRVDRPDGTSHVQQLQCSACACALTLPHLTICDGVTRLSYRRRLQTAILDCLQASGARPAWIDTNRRRSLDRVLLSLFPLPSAARAIATDAAVHLTRCFVGLFVEGEGITAVSALDVSDRNVGHDVLCRLRLICLDHLDQFYSNLKVPH